MTEHEHMQEVPISFDSKGEEPIDLNINISEDTEVIEAEEDIEFTKNGIMKQRMRYIKIALGIVLIAGILIMTLNYYYNSHKVKDVDQIIVKYEMDQNESQKVIDKLEIDRLVGELIKNDVKLNNLIASGDYKQVKKHFLKKFLELNEKIGKSELIQYKEQVNNELCERARFVALDSKKKRRVKFNQDKVINYYKYDDKIKEIKPKSKLKSAIKKPYVHHVNVITDSEKLEVIDPSKTVRIDREAQAYADEIMKNNEELKILIENGVLPKLKDQIEIELQKDSKLDADLKSRVKRELYGRAVRVNTLKKSINRTPENVLKYLKEFKSSPQFGVLKNEKVPKSKTLTRKCD